MTLRLALITAFFTVIAAVLGWFLFVGLPQRAATRSGRAATAAPAAVPATPGKKIKARLFYITNDGTRLTSVERDVPYADGTIPQAKAIVEAQIAPPGESFVSPVPTGTTLRALFVTPKGEAYVDLSSELRTGHPGGSLTEMLTVYSIVDALTVNLPAVTTVQVLIDGKEVETLAGHVDLRRPLIKNLSWVEQTESP